MTMPLFTIPIYSIFFTSFLSSNQPNELPHPFEARWKGQSICEVLQDNDNKRLKPNTNLP